MKNIRHLILKVTRKSPPICRQMELSLPGSRLTRDEANFLREDPSGSRADRGTRP